MPKNKEPEAVTIPVKKVTTPESTKKDTKSESDKEKTTPESAKEVTTPEEEHTKVASIRNFNAEQWTPKTSLGKKVRDGKIIEIDSIFDEGKRIMEVEIVDSLFPNLESELLLVGQAKGKFGGGKRRVFRQTQKKTKEGNKPKFSTIIVVGNKNGFVGIGRGKSKETVPAREKSLRNAKLGIFKIKRGCGSWKCGCKQPHSVPFTVTGKCGSVKITIMPAPKGNGLCIENECKKILRLAGINDVWSRTEGHTSTKNNLIYACVDALHQLTKIKTQKAWEETAGVIEGAYKKE